MKKSFEVACSPSVQLGAGGVGAADPIILKVAHFWPPTAMSQQKVLEPWCAKIEKDSTGRMKCQIYPAMQLGGGGAPAADPTGAGRRSRYRVDAASGYTAGRYPSMEVFELPFDDNRAEPASRAAWHYYEQFGKEDFAKVKPLAFHVRRRLCSQQQAPDHKAVGLPWPQDARTDAPDQQDDRRLRRHPGGDAAAGRGRGGVQGRGRRLRAALGSDSGGQVARDDQYHLQTDKSQPSLATPRCSSWP